MAHFLILLVSCFVAFSSALSLPAFPREFPASSISAAPALQPHDRPVSPFSSSPASSPDITPLLPSPAGSDLSPAGSSLPLIPSSPSPPNPDAAAASGPGSAFGASELMPSSSSTRLNAQEFFKTTMLVLCLVVFGLKVGVFSW